jgi:hypothetical protein
MPAAAPLIYVRVPEQVRVGWLGRIWAGALSLTCLAVLIVAASLDPSPRGVGTHEQLGLDPCQFEARTGVPCPTCGMTTSFACFVRGRMLASLYVQPLASVLALGTATLFWAGGYITLTGRPVYRLLRWIQPRYYLLPFFALTVLAWGWKIWTHLSGRGVWNN